MWTRARNPSSFNSKSQSGWSNGAAMRTRGMGARGTLEIHTIFICSPPQPLTYKTRMSRNTARLDPIDPNAEVRYIKLGVGGGWEKPAIDGDICVIGFGSQTPERF